MVNDDWVKMEKQRFKGVAATHRAFIRDYSGMYASNPNKIELVLNSKILADLGDPDRLNIFIGKRTQEIVLIPSKENSARKISKSTVNSNVLSVAGFKNELENLESFNGFPVNLLVDRLEEIEGKPVLVLKIAPKA